MLEQIGDEKANINMSDPEAKLMNHKDGRSLPSYNHQSAVDGALGVTCVVKTEDRCDGEQDLLELADEAKRNTGEEHQNILADSAFGGYGVYQEIAEERSEDFYVPDRRRATDEKGQTSKGKFCGSQFDRREDGTIICPAGQPMELREQRRQGDHTELIYAGTACGSCRLQQKCTKGEVRRVSIDSREPLRRQMRQKLDTDRGREIYMKRQGIVEAVHGNDQRNKGWRQHLLRGKAKASLEFMLVRIGANLGKIVAYRSREVLALA